MLCFDLLKIYQCFRRWSIEMIVLYTIFGADLLKQNFN